jgi:hypothetical protein
MKVNTEWSNKLPLPNNFNQFVLVTLYNSKDNCHWVEIGYLDEFGVFKDGDGMKLCYPVVAWANLPEPFKTNPL